MLRSKHILAAALYCFAVLSVHSHVVPEYRIKFEPGPCPNVSTENVEWDDLLKNAESRFPNRLRTSFYWDPNYLHQSGEGFTCLPGLVIDPYLDLRVLATDNNEFAVIFECREIDGQHSQIISTLTKRDDQHMSEEIIEDIKRAHDKNGYASEYLVKCTPQGLLD